MKFVLWACAVQLGTAIEAVHKEKPPNPDEVPLPAVPGVQSAGQSGFPELPAVSAMLDESTQTLSGISSQAQRLQEQMLQVQKENAGRLQRQKAVFDRKLREQEQKNLGVVKENAMIAKKIMSMKEQNQELLKHAQGLQKGNSLRHGELKMLKEQMSAAQKFLDDTVAQTDDTKAAELQVLANSSAPSFLQIEEDSLEAPVDLVDSKAAEAEPESLLSMLGSEVKTMKKQGHESESKLKSLFLADFQAGMKRYKALVAQQKVLNQTLEKMKSYRSRLEAADAHLQQTQSSLQSRLHDGGLFMQKLSELTLAKPEAAVHALETLTKH